MVPNNLSNLDIQHLLNNIYLVQRGAPRWTTTLGQTTGDGEAVLQSCSLPLARPLPSRALSPVSFFLVTILFFSQCFLGTLSVVSIFCSDDSPDSPSLELFVLSPPKNQSRPPSSVLLPSPVLYPASKRAWPLRLPACRPDCPSDPRITPLTCHRSPCSLCCCPVSVLLCRCLQRRPTAGGRWPACARAGLKGKRKTKAGPGLA